MISLFAALILSVVVVLMASQFLLRMRMLQAAEPLPPSRSIAGRYRPMVRLLSSEDFEFVAGNPVALKSLRAQRRKLFRSYLNCLTKDYARLLAGIRLVMVQSGSDRPDLVRALAKNRALFALAICKVEFRLALHWAGIGKVEIAGLVGAFDALRDQVAAFSTAAPSLA